VLFFLMKVVALTACTLTSVFPEFRKVGSLRRDCGQLFCAINVQLVWRKGQTVHQSPASNQKLSANSSAVKHPVHLA